jgi:hypothetical protein
VRSFDTVQTSTSLSDVPAALPSGVRAVGGAAAVSARAAVAAVMSLFIDLLLEARHSGRAREKF